MKELFLPTLISINIKDYTLYPKNKNIEYSFINGVNLIIGGNGIGKTTFINLIRYGLVGLYRKDVDVRVYLEKKIENRIQYANDYFRSRMEPDNLNNQKAKVVLKFRIKDSVYQVKRSLFDLNIEEVLIKKDNDINRLEGKILRQNQYHKLTQEDKKTCLQYNYEENITCVTGFSCFDDFIFFVNEILLFGENRKTIMWDGEIQERLSSKYFNNPKLDQEFEENKRLAKYNDSLARHKSEEIKAINRVVGKINDASKNNDNDFKDYVELKSNLEKIQKKQVNIQNDRIEKDNKLKTLISQRTRINQEISHLEQINRQIQVNINKELWETLNQKYFTYLENIKINKICPLCNKEINNQLYNRILSSEENCFFCEQKIDHNNVENLEIEENKKELDKKYAFKQNLEIEILNLEKELLQLDEEYSKSTIRSSNLMSTMRSLEYSLSNKVDTTNVDTSYIIMQKEIKKLESEKKEFQDKKDYFENRNTFIVKQMEESNISINRELSIIFRDYVANFLKSDAYLTYDEFEHKGRRYYPVINNKVRFYPDELSESQSFFVDHSFRMSLLNYFYVNPTFFICETPDSSLDISYERNAADIFLKYLNKPNALIITSNLNNSEFLEYIIANSKDINYINLLEVGRPSIIQDTSERLVEISNSIEEKINAKRRFI